MKIIITRHGETTHNAQGILAGHKPGELSDIGKQQVQLLGKSLKDTVIDKIYSSDLTRSKETTKAILEYQECEVEYLAALRERSYGIFEDKSLDEYIQDRANSGISLEDYKPQNGESIKDVCKRVNKFLATLNFNNGQCILLSAHGELNKMIIRYFLKLSYDEARSIPQENTCINILEIIPGENRLLSQNNTSHLTPELLNTRDALTK